MTGLGLTPGRDPGPGRVTGPGSTLGIFTPGNKPRLLARISSTAPAVTPALSATDLTTIPAGSDANLNPGGTGPGSIGVGLTLGRGPGRVTGPDSTVGFVMGLSAPRSLASIFLVSTIMTLPAVVVMFTILPGAWVTSLTPFGANGASSTTSSSPAAMRCAGVRELSNDSLNGTRRARVAAASLPVSAGVRARTSAFSLSASARLPWPINRCWFRTSASVANPGPGAGSNRGVSPALAAMAISRNSASVADGPKVLSARSAARPSFIRSAAAWPNVGLLRPSGWRGAPRPVCC